MLRMSNDDNLYIIIKYIYIYSIIGTYIYSNSGGFKLNSADEINATAISHI